MNSERRLSAGSLPVRQDLSSLGLWGPTSAKLSCLFPPKSHGGDVRPAAGAPHCRLHTVIAAGPPSAVLSLFYFFFFLNIKTLPVLDTPSPRHAMMRFGFVPSQKWPLPPLLSRSARLHLPLGFCPVLHRKQVCVFSPEPERKMQEMRWARSRLGARLAAERRAEAARAHRPRGGGES